MEGSVVTFENFTDVKLKQSNPDASHTWLLTDSTSGVSREPQSIFWETKAVQSNR